jgi:hypothetical protein
MESHREGHAVGFKGSTVLASEAIRLMHDLSCPREKERSDVEEAWWPWSSYGTVHPSSMVVSGRLIDVDDERVVGTQAKV